MEIYIFINCLWAHTLLIRNEKKNFNISVERKHIGQIVH